MSDESEAPSQETASFSHNFHFLIIYQKWYLMSVELIFFKFFECLKQSSSRYSSPAGRGSPSHSSRSKRKRSRSRKRSKSKSKSRRREKSRDSRERGHKSRDRSRSRSRRSHSHSRSKSKRERKSRSREEWSTIFNQFYIIFLTKMTIPAKCLLEKGRFA